MVKRISFIVFLLVLIVVVGSGVSVNAQNLSQIDNFTASSYAEYYPCDKSEIELYTLDNYDGYITISGEIIYVNVLDILTPNSSYVEVYETGNDMSTALINAYNNHYDSEFSDAIRKSSATAHYNCHSYAWYSQSPSTNNYWMNDPSNYYEDNGYIEVETPRSGDIICYFDDKGTSTENDDENLHSGIVIEYYSNITSNNICGNSNKVKVISKWGPAGLYEHYGDYCPYVSTYDGDADYVRYYRPKTNASYTLSNSSSQITETVTITSSNDNTNNYEMYELNVSDSKNYIFEISSYYSMDVRLYDEHMQLLTYLDTNISNRRICFNENLSSGKYYIRVAFDSTSKTGTINVSIGNNTHTHYYLWEYHNNISHIETCSCGLTGTTTRAHAIRSSDVGKRYVECLECHDILDMNEDMAFSELPLNNTNIKYSVNGSYILPNGLVVLVDNDIDAYLSGTLVFYNLDDLPVGQ